jgi:hypothetical protein
VLPEVLQQLRTTIVKGANDRIAPDLIGEFAYPLPVANQTATAIRFQGVNSVDDFLPQFGRPCAPDNRIRQVNRARLAIGSQKMGRGAPDKPGDRKRTRRCSSLKIGRLVCA